jgi:hypothetical protein
MSNSTHQGTREMCRIVKDVGILRFYLQTIYSMDLTHELIYTNSSFGFVGLNKLIRKIHGIYNTESVNRRTNNTMAKRKSTKEQTYKCRILLAYF